MISFLFCPASLYDKLLYMFILENFNVISVFHFIVADVKNVSRPVFFFQHAHTQTNRFYTQKNIFVLKNTTSKHLVQ